jgi:hypothetical protein
MVFLSSYVSSGPPIFSLCLLKVWFLIHKSYNPIFLCIPSSLWPRLLILWLHSLFLWPFDLQDIFFLPEPVFLNVYEAQESIPRNEFRQPM